MARAAIETIGLVKTYGSVRAVDGVDLNVPEATVFGLLGPNGAGKTTIVRMLTTTVRPDAGQAFVLGVDVAAAPERARQLIGLAGQYAAVDEHLTGRENLRLVGRLTHLPKAQYRKRADELLELFALSDAADRPSRTYSGGMRRRLDLAASLVHQPPVLFLDEPTTGLDPASRKDLWAVIESLVDGGTTVLLTTQYLEEADRLADRIAVIDRGRVIAEGSSAELKADLGSTVVEIGFLDPEQATAARQTLGHLQPASGAGRNELLFTTTHGPALLSEALRLLSAASLEPATIAVREPSLDDVFLNLTGHTAEQASEPATARPTGLPATERRPA